MNITPRWVLSRILQASPTQVGQYTLKDGTKVPAVGFLGLRDQRVTETEGVEILITPIPTGTYSYEASYHTFDQGGGYLVRLLQHRAQQYWLPHFVHVCASIAKVGKISYTHDDSGTQAVPYADVFIGFSNLQITTLESYEAECSFDKDCPVLPG